MRPKSPLPGLVLVALLATVLTGSAVVAAAGSPLTDVAQSTNQTAANGTENVTSVNSTVGNITVWTGPMSAFEDLTSPAAFRTAMAQGRLRRNESIPENGGVPWSTLEDRNAVAVNDTVVFAVEAPGLVDAVVSANDTDSDASGFVRLVNRSWGYGFRMEQTPATSRPGNLERVLNLSATLAADGIRVAPDERNGTLYLALRLDRTVLDRGFPSDDSVDADEAYDVTVTAGDASSTTEIGIVRPPLSFDTDAGSVVRFGTEPCGLVTGQAYPGVDVELDADVRYPESRSLEVPTTTRTAADGRFTSCINTTELPSNATLRLTGDGFRGSVTGVVGSGDLTSVHLVDQTATNRTAVVNATFTDPGFVALYRASSIDALAPANRSEKCSFPPHLDRRAAESRLVGVSELREPGGDTVPVELTRDLNGSTRLLAIVHYDRDDDGQFDYPGPDYPNCAFSGTPVSDTATISPVEQSPSGTVSANATATDAPPSTGTTGSTTANTTTADGTGFSPTITALALIVVALLARRQI